MNLILAIPADLKDPANQLAEIMGWGAGCYSVQLSADGSEPATHWALHLATVQKQFTAMLEGAKGGTMPDDLRAGGFPEDVFLAIMSSLIVEAGVPFDEALAKHGLVRVEGDAV